MQLDGSCHCKAVTFSVESKHPYPYNQCYCEICRKTAGAGGFAINISALADTLNVIGEDNIRSYQARKVDAETGNTTHSPLERKFCGTCGSALWAWDARWPELLHPHASAIDTELPKPPKRTHLMLSSKAAWVNVNADPQDSQFAKYPDESIAAWHQRLGLES